MKTLKINQYLFPTQKSTLQYYSFNCSFQVCVNVKSVRHRFIQLIFRFIHISLPFLCSPFHIPGIWTHLFHLCNLLWWGSPKLQFLSLYFILLLKRHFARHTINWLIVMSLGILLLSFHCLLQSTVYCWKISCQLFTLLPLKVICLLLSPGCSTPVPLLNSEKVPLKILTLPIFSNLSFWNSD